MYSKRRLVKAIKILSRRFSTFSNKYLTAINKSINWLLRTLFITRRRRESANAGFVLPTVAMVAIVVVLLTTAILFRSFERSKNASNVRVNEAVLSAAAPALDRAKAKINKLFQDPRLPRSTPSDFSLYEIATNNINQFTFGDETQLKLVNDFNGQSGIQTNTGSLDTEESLTTAWKYPVDTNNDGKFDSFTLYGIYLRSPLSNRPRSPLEARTPPMNETSKGTQCDAGAATSAQLVGSQGWFKRNGTLKRGIFVYTTTVPITDIAGLDSTKYQKFTGNKGFAALEYEQDRERVPISNNAVLYNDDLEIAPGGGLRLNGRIVTNANLLTGKSSNDIKFFLVSSPKSCYYNEANSKIVVGGNVANGKVTNTTTDMTAATDDGVRVDFFKAAGPGASDRDFINSTNKTVTNFASKIAYNSKAYEMRIKRLVDAAMSLTTLPKDVSEEITRQTTADTTLNANTVKREQLQIYFRKRTRRVPYAEVGFGQENTKALKDSSTDYTTSDPLKGSNTDNLRPPDEWILPYAASDGINHINYSNLAIKTNGATKISLPATATKFPEPQGDEASIGDRVVVGNNLPEIWWNGTKFVSQLDGQDGGQTISGKVWDAAGSGTNPRKRFPQVHQLDDLGVTDRDDFWEKKAAEQTQGALDVVGGLRVITGAGIYLPKDYDLTDTTKFTTALTATDKVWSDSMAVVTTPLANTPLLNTPNDVLPKLETPSLRMRATAVYHYTQSSFDPKVATTNPQTPIACVSSFYDPSNSTTATNRLNLPDVSSINTTYPAALITGSPGNSNNGVVYAAPTKTKADYTAVLTYQASLKYPNGLLVNEPLQKALAKGSGNLTLSDKSALDSAICALEILDSSLAKTPMTSPVIPHGAIRETAFLDARQVKAIDKPGTTNATTYNLDVELRQPLEIRATVLDLNLLRGKSIGTGEFLLPNSGIIYATRDDAVPDKSDSTPDLSATDFNLDPNRRPHGIMLINGSNISRNSTYKAEEKGLILATNLPVYIKGDFNKHTQEEFTNNLAADWSNFYSVGGSSPRNTLNPQFACRSGQFSGCTTGETWRPATIIADAITILSGNFKEGFRNEGDYDLRDNVAPLGYDYDGAAGIGTNAVNIDERTVQFDVNGNGSIDTTPVSITEQNIPSVVAHRLNGFWDNNFVTSLGWTGNDTGNSYDFGTTNPINSSYFNNFVTPIQRRTSFPEYVMEICRKATISACKPSDWSVGYAATVTATGGVVDWNYKATNSTATGANRILTKDSSFTFDKLGAGTTARPALNAADRRYPRRVAFLHDSTGNLITTGAAPNLKPIPLGITSNNQVNYFPYEDTTIGTTPTPTPAPTPAPTLPSYPAYSLANKPRLQNSALWFQTTNAGTANYSYDFPLAIANSSGLTNTINTDQPLLTPVLQIQYPFGSSGTDLPITTLNSGSNYTKNIKDHNPTNNWMQKANPGTTALTVETNLAFVQGDTPGRPDESNGGLENFVRYLENWDNTNHKISGAFIQYKRSSYATAPWSTFATAFGTVATGYGITTNFGYPQGYRITVNNDTGKTFGRTPFFIQPERLWGFDVALLTQLPDLFSQRFTSPSVGDPNEYYREVARDDRWVETLLCAAQLNTYTDGFGTALSSKYGANQKYAIPVDQRPNSCRS